MVILHQVFCDHCSTIEGESELSRNWHRIIYQPYIISCTFTLVNYSHVSKIYIKFYLSEPFIDRPSICVKPFISSSVPQLNNESESVSVLESEPLNLAYHLYRHLNMMCHFLNSYPGVCSLDAYVSFPGMMQGDKRYIKVNLGIALV